MAFAAGVVPKGMVPGFSLLVVMIEFQMKKAQPRQEPLR